MARSETATQFNGTIDNNHALDLTCTETMEPGGGDDDEPMPDGTRRFSSHHPPPPLSQQHRVPVVASATIAANVTAKLHKPSAAKSTPSTAIGDGVAIDDPPHGPAMQAALFAAAAVASGPSTSHARPPSPVGKSAQARTAIGGAGGGGVPPGGQGQSATIAINNHRENTSIYANPARPSAPNATIFNKTMFKPYSPSSPFPSASPPTLPVGFLSQPPAVSVFAPLDAMTYAAATSHAGGSRMLPALTAATAALIRQHTSILQQQVGGVAFEGGNYIYQMLANTVLNFAAGKLAPTPQTLANFVMPVANSSKTVNAVARATTPNKPPPTNSPRPSSCATGATSASLPATPVANNAANATPTTPGPSPRPSILRKFREGGAAGTTQSSAVRKLALDGNGGGTRPASAAAAMSGNGGGTTVARIDSPCGGDESNHSSLSCSSVQSSFAPPGDRLASSSPGGDNSPRKRLRKQRFDQHAPPDRVKVGRLPIAGIGESKHLQMGGSARNVEGGERRVNADLPAWRLTPSGGADTKRTGGHSSGRRPGRPLSRPSTAPAVQFSNAGGGESANHAKSSKQRRPPAPIQEEPESSSDDSDSDDDDSSSSRMLRRKWQIEDDTDRMSPPPLRLPCSPSEVIPYSTRYPCSPSTPPSATTDGDATAERPVYRPRPRLTNAYVLSYSPRRNHFKRFDMVKLSSAARRGKLDATAALEASFDAMEEDDGRWDEGEEDDDVYCRSSSAANQRELHHLAHRLVNDGNFVAAISHWRLNRVLEHLNATDRYEEENGSRLAAWAQSAGACVATSEEAVAWLDRWRDTNECCDAWMQPQKGGGRRSPPAIGAAIANALNNNGAGPTTIDDDVSVCTNPSSALINQLMKLKSPYLGDWAIAGGSSEKNGEIDCDTGQEEDTVSNSRKSSEIGGESHNDVSLPCRYDRMSVSSFISSSSLSATATVSTSAMPPPGDDLDDRSSPCGNSSGECPRQKARRRRSAIVTRDEERQTRRLRELAATMARRNAALRAMIADVRTSFRGISRHGARIERCVRRLAAGVGGSRLEGGTRKAALRSSARTAGLRVPDQLPSH